MSTISKYNSLIKRIARNHSARFGIETVTARRSEARMIRDLRRTFPLSQYGVTWS